ncbi:MAG: cytochrome c oxidase subunit II [Alphaproteobacteria bacterium]|nr:cytochrome c oxidase subunit II [Alphaproteobacteria bacterium]
MSAPAFAVLGQPVPGGMNFQEAASPMKEKMAFFHNHLLMPIMMTITAFVFLLLLIVIIRFNAKANPVPSKTTHNVLLEVVWTLIPVLILITIAIPSMKMLYYVDKTADAEMTLKITGSQWYWSYDYPDDGGINFISNLVPEKDLKEGQPRLLATDNPVVLPVDTNIKLLMTATDVVHSWAVPAFVVKLDAVPGRLNETWVRIDKEGTFYGQCSEICGTGHGFMPIEVHAVSKKAFAEWVKKQGGKMPSASFAEASQKTKTEETGEK